jgi:hypothetical protein
MHFFLVPDQDYVRWVARHPDGYVMRIQSCSGAAPQVLHRARCRHLSSDDASDRGPYPCARVCSTDRRQIDAWADWEGYSFAGCADCGVEAWPANVDDAPRYTPAPITPRIDIASLVPTKTADVGMRAMVPAEGSSLGEA